MSNIRVKFINNKIKIEKKEDKVGGILVPFAPIYWDPWGDDEFYLSSENIGSFKSYSLNQNLIEEYYNKGISTQNINLSNGQNNNGNFLLEILLEDGLIGSGYIFPNNIEVYFYDEKLNDVNIEGSFNFEKVIDENKILITLNQNLQQGNFSFQANIEHRTIHTERRVFNFNEFKKYSYDITLIPSVPTSPKRLTQEYISYLIQWIEQCWIKYESNNIESIDPLQDPNNGSAFDPFEHAKYAVRRDSDES